MDKIKTVYTVNYKKNNNACYNCDQMKNDIKDGKWKKTRKILLINRCLVKLIFPIAFIKFILFVNPDNLKRSKINAKLPVLISFRIHI